MLTGNRTLLTLFAIGTLQSFTRWFELLAFGVYVYDRTQSPLLVAFVTLAKFAPLVLFGPLFGALPSRYASRNLYLIGITAMIVVNAAGWWLASGVDINAPLLLAVSFIGGLFWVLDFPVRRALIGDAVSSSMLGKAMAIDTIANNGTRMLGPVLGGTLLQLAGLSGTFAIATTVYCFCLLLTVQLTVGRTVTTGGSELALTQLVMSGGQLVR